VIASLNAVTLDGWIGYAARLEQAGAAALELNAYAITADASMSGRTSSPPHRHRARVRSTVKIRLR